MAAALPLVFTAGWASGLNPYLFALLCGVLGRLGWAGSPDALERLDVLAVLAVLVAVDAVAGKIAWLDSVWDGVNTFIRPIAGGAMSVLLAAPDTPLAAAVAAGSGGAVALAAHLAKTTIRLAVNTSPEPASNIVVGLGEDLAVAGVVLLLCAYPWAAAMVAAALLALAFVIAGAAAGAARSLWRARRQKRQ